MPTSDRGLSRRRLQPELMDDPALDPGAHERALRALERINALSGVTRLLWPPIRRLAREGSVRILDIATGGGDVPRSLARRARRDGLDVRIDGCDRSPTAVAFAGTCAQREGLAARFFVHDVLQDPLPVGYDVLVSSLFLHHLEEEDARALLLRMARAARRLVLVCDLERCRAGHALAWSATRVLCRSSVVRVDGPRSVEAAFRAGEASALASRAGLAGARIERRFPFRWVLAWSRG